MKNFLLNRLIGFAGRKLNGVKTYLAGAGFILLAVVGCVGKLFPEQGLPEMDWDTIGANFSGGMALFGVGHKLEKIAAPSSSPNPGGSEGGTHVGSN